MSLDVFNFTPRRLTVLERPQEADPVTREYLDCGCLKFSDGEVWFCEMHDVEFMRVVKETENAKEVHRG